MSTLERLRAVDATELKFRVACELRKAGGRVRSAVVPAQWRRRDLALAAPTSDGEMDGVDVGRAREALSRGDWTSAHRALVAHFASRPRRFPIDPSGLPKLREEIAARFPDARSAAIVRADRMLEGRYDVLGYADVPYGTPPAWHRDPLHGRQPPLAFWSAVPYLDPQYGDHKVIWEINRHQHWLGLARAHELTGDRRYYDAFVAQLGNWMATNPPLQGINWASMLELAFRSLSWIWALHFFAPAAVDASNDRASWSVDLLLGIDRQLIHVEHNLSRYFSPNTHLSGEALALFVGGCVLPELASSGRRRAVGRQVLLEQIDRQVNSDGGHSELSAHYHRYSTDFYLLAAEVARLCGDEAAPLLQRAAGRQAQYLRAITDDNGRLPLIGDDDGGQLFPVCGRDVSDCRDTLSSAAAIVGDPALAAWTTPEETLWFCGTSTPACGPASPARSQAFAASGYYVSRNSAADHLIFDAGRHGFLNGGHAHADALSIVLTIGGRPFLVDAGTGTYTMDAVVRDRLRSTAMHNTVALDGRPQSEPRGPFHWATRADAKCLVWLSEQRFDYVEGIHGGYLPKVHARAVLAIHGIGWIVLDHVLGPAEACTTADMFWHIHPDWEHPSDGGLSFRHRDGTVRSITSTANLHVLARDEAEDLDTYSPAYGAFQRGTCLRARVVLNSPSTIATFMTATAVAGMPSLEQVDVTEPPGANWHAAAFRLAWSGHEAIILCAIERVPDSDAGTPGRLWGGERARTDGRVAFIQLGARNPTPPIQVLGTRAEPAEFAGSGRA